MRAMAASLLLLGTLASAAPLAAAQQTQEPLTNVRVVEATWIRDVAMMRREGGRPVIYINPRLLDRFGPVMRDFFIAHEYGHVAHGHDAGEFTWQHHDAPPVDSLFARTRQRQELEADCYATRTLAESEPETVGAALRFFNRMGPFRFDAWHPSGSQRAAKILACLPQAEDQTAERMPGEPTNSSDRSSVSNTPVTSPVTAAVPPDAPPT